MRAPYKVVSTEALLSNYRYLKALCAPSKILAVVKSNAYGHGILKVTRTLADAGGFAVASVEEGMALRKASVKNKILVLQGAHREEDFAAAAQYGLDLVVHCSEQLDYLEAHPQQELHELWIKFDTGMNRLGFPAENSDRVINRVKSLPALRTPPVLMSHFCCMDSPDQTMTQTQWQRFQSLCAGHNLPASIVNSLGCLRMPEARMQWSRLGIALYGIVPDDEHRQSLTPVMSLFAPVIAVKRCRTGEGIGYGRRYVCPKDMTIGIVAIGYGDGYPWGAPDGTPVWLGNRKEVLLGRVSMDMIAVSISANQAAIGDWAELWGTHIAVDEVAERCGTISYDLLTSASGISELESEVPR